MSVQSESGRIDYAKSDHAPKGQRTAEADIKYFDKSFEDKATKGREKNRAAEQDWSNMGIVPDLTNVVAGPGNLGR